MKNILKWLPLTVLAAAIGCADPKPAPTLLELGTTTCTYSREMKVVLDQLQKESAGKLVIEIVDLDKNPEMDKKYPVKTVPVQIFLDASGKELFRHELSYSKGEIVAKWKELGYDVAPQSTSRPVIKVGGG
jgi:thioredoxin 1